MARGGALGGSRDDRSAPPLAPSAVGEAVRSLQEALSHAISCAVACEPTAEGILSGVGTLYLAHADPARVRLVGRDSCQPRLGEQLVSGPSCAADETVALAQRVLSGFEHHVSEGCPRARAGRCPRGCTGSCVRRVLYACASSTETAPEVVHRYLRLAFERGGVVRSALQDPRVADLHALSLSVSGECERTRQFVRFSRQEDGSFAATFSPRDDTIPLTSGYFAARLLDDRFFVLDPVHLVAAFHLPGRRDCGLVRLDAAEAAALAARRSDAPEEAYVEALWRRFYECVALPGRDRSQRGYDLRTSWVPKRFWAGLPELAETAAQGSGLPA